MVIRREVRLHERDVLCREKICAAKDKLGLKLDSSVQDNKKFLEHVSVDSVGPELKFVK